MYLGTIRAASHLFLKTYEESWFAFSVAFIHNDIKKLQSTSVSLISLKEQQSKATYINAIIKIVLM